MLFTPRWISAGPRVGLNQSFPRPNVSGGARRDGNEPVANPLRSNRKSCHDPRRVFVPLLKTMAHRAKGVRAVSIKGIRRIRAIQIIVNPVRCPIPFNRLNRAKLLPRGFPHKPPRSIVIKGSSTTFVEHCSVQKKAFSSPVRVPYTLVSIG